MYRQVPEPFQQWNSSEPDLYKRGGSERTARTARTARDWAGQQAVSVEPQTQFERMHNHIFRKNGRYLRFENRILDKTKRIISLLNNLKNPGQIYNILYQASENAGSKNVKNSFKYKIILLFHF